LKKKLVSKNATEEKMEIVEKILIEEENMGDCFFQIPRLYSEGAPSHLLNSFLGPQKSFTKTTA